MKRWNDVEKGKGKYLQLLESLQQSERKREKQRIELEEQNGYLKPENDDIILKIIDKLKEWFGKTKIDEASDSWENFIDLKRKESEKLDDFLLRFETTESTLRSSAVELPNVVLALQLIKSVNVNSNQRRNILVHVDMDKTDTVYDDMKSSIRLMKGSIVEKDTEANNDDDEVNYNQSFKNHQSRSRSTHRYNDKKGSYYGQGNRSYNGQGNGSYSGQGNSSYNRQGNSRERGRSQQNRGRSRETHRSKERSPFRRQRTKSRDYSRNRQNYGGEQLYESSNLVFKETEHESQIETGDNDDKMIVDSGTTKTVAGKKWMDNHLANITSEEQKHVEKHPEERFFRFGDSARYPSTQEIEFFCRRCIYSITAWKTRSKTIRICY